MQSPSFLPIDLFEYKLRWRTRQPHIIFIHSDLRQKAKKICKSQFARHKWHMSLYTDNYQDSWLFEDLEDANKFYDYFTLGNIMTKKNKLMEVLGKLSLEIYDHIGGLNFKEESFHVAIGHELTLKNIEYLRETSIELYYKKIPIRLGEIDFYLNNEKPPTIIEVKIHSSIVNTHRQQLKMYLLSIKRNPKSILKKVENGILINFLKENPTTHEEEESTRVKDLYKVEMEMFTLGKNDELKLLAKESLGLISK